MAWVAWREEQWNHPSRSDHYLMRLAREVALAPSRVWGGKDPTDGTLAAYRLSFSQKTKAPATPPLPKGFPRLATKEDIAKMQKAALLHNLGVTNAS